MSFLFNHSPEFPCRKEGGFLIGNSLLQDEGKWVFGLPNPLDQKMGTWGLLGWDAVVLANGPIQANRPKWLGEGAKGLLGRGSQSLKKGSCTTKTLFCTSATQHFTGAKGIWPDCTQRPFAPSPNHFGAISLNPVICQDHSFPTVVGIPTRERTHLLVPLPLRTCPNKRVTVIMVGVFHY